MSPRDPQFYRAIYKPAKTEHRMLFSHSVVESFNAAIAAANGQIIQEEMYRLAFLYKIPAGKENPISGHGWEGWEVKATDEVGDVDHGSE